MNRKQKPGGNRAGGNGGGHSQLDYTTHAAAGVTPMRLGNGKVVGYLEGCRLFKRAQQGHMLREPAAWAWDCAILEAAERGGARFTEVECDGLIYRASLADFRHYGFPVNRRHGAQRGLPLAHWHIRRVGEPPAAIQLSLWGNE